MTEPRRLLDDETAPPALRGALRAAATAEPPYDAAAGLARFQATIAAGPPPSHRVLVRVAAAGAVVAVVAGLALVALRFAEPTPVAPPAIPPAPSPAPPPALPISPLAPPAEQVQSDTLQVPVPAVNDAVDVEAPSPTRVRGGDSLALELRLVVDARRNTHTLPARSLALLARADREVGEGVLGRERETLRIEALSALGRTEDAARRARAFLAAHPGDPLEARVRAALGGAR